MVWYCSFPRNKVADVRQYNEPQPQCPFPAWLRGIHLDQPSVVRVAMQEYKYGEHVQDLEFDDAHQSFLLSIFNNEKMRLPVTLSMMIKRF